VASAVKALPFSRRSFCYCDLPPRLGRAGGASRGDIGGCRGLPRALRRGSMTHKRHFPVVRQSFMPHKRASWRPLRGPMTHYGGCGRHSRRLVRHYGSFRSDASTFRCGASTFGSEASTFGSEAPSFRSEARTFRSEAPSFGSGASSLRSGHRPSVVGHKPSGRSPGPSVVRHRASVVCPRAPVVRHQASPDGHQASARPQACGSGADGFSAPFSGFATLPSLARVSSPGFIGLLGSRASVGLTRWWSASGRPAFDPRPGSLPLCGDLRMVSPRPRRVTLVRVRQTLEKAADARTRRRTCLS
jgi:hypothetical protein